MGLMFTNSLVFLAHGMGEYEVGWSDDFFKTLDKSIETNGYSKIQQALEDKSLESVKELIDCQELLYADVFDEIIQNWAKNAEDAIARAATLPEKNKIAQSVDWLGDSGVANDSFVWTHVLDVFFWATSSYVRSLVKNRVADSLTQNVASRMKEAGPKRFLISGMAHSLGTSVLQQTLQSLYAGEWAGQRWNPQYVQFDVYHAVANVSNLFEFVGFSSPYEGYCRPAGMGQSGVYYFNNYRHVLDPFTLVSRFSPTDWPKALYDDVEIKHIRQLNVHALEHYAQHPSVHIRILRSWFGYNCVSPEEERVAQEKFKDVPTAALTARAAKALEQSNLIERNLTASPDLLDLLKAVAAYARNMAKK